MVLAGSPRVSTAVELNEEVTVDTVYMGDNLIPCHPVGVVVPWNYIGPGVAPPNNGECMGDVEEGL